MTDLTAHVDGAARGNPGPAGIGVVLVDQRGQVVKQITEGLGITTNNVAEYKALIRALEEAHALGCSRITVYTDSELMAMQINGRYRVKAPHLVPLFVRAMQLLAQFEKATVTHTHRHNNSLADMLSKIAAEKSAEEEQPLELQKP
jgi:ribonuclease HI